MFLKVWTYTELLPISMHVHMKEQYCQRICGDYCMTTSISEHFNFWIQDETSFRCLDAGELQRTAMEASHCGMQRPKLASYEQIHVP